MDAAKTALREIVEEWAGAECGEPVHAQEAYAIALARRMYEIAAAALAEPGEADAAGYLRVIEDRNKFIDGLEAKVEALEASTAFKDATNARLQSLLEGEDRLREDIQRLRGPILTAECVDWGLTSEEIDRQFRALVVENRRLRGWGSQLGFVSASPSAGTEQATAPKPTD